MGWLNGACPERREEPPPPFTDVQVEAPTACWFVSQLSRTDAVCGRKRRRKRHARGEPPPVIAAAAAGRTASSTPAVDAGIQSGEPPRPSQRAPLRLDTSPGRLGEAWPLTRWVFLGRRAKQTPRASLKGHDSILRFWGKANMPRERHGSGGAVSESHSEGREGAEALRGG